jgi:hypothetical protein
MENGAIDEFISITQASSSVAKQFLKAFDDNVQAAVEAFFEDPEKYDGLSPAIKSDLIDDEFIGGDSGLTEEYVREPMKQVRKRLVADDVPVGRGRGAALRQPTEAFRDLRREHNTMFSGAIILYSIVFFCISS